MQTMPAPPPADAADTASFDAVMPSPAAGDGPVNDFVPFAWTAAANVQDQLTYAASATTQSGFEAGVAQSAMCNKVWRQGAFVAAGVSQFVLQQLNISVPDDGDLNTWVSNFTAAVGHLVGVVGQGVPEAPMDGVLYGRRSATWVGPVALLTDLSAYMLANNGTATNAAVSLRADPVAAMDSVTLQYLNSRMAGIPSGNYLPLTGGTLYNAGGSNLLTIRTDVGRDNYVIFTGQRNWYIGVGGATNIGYFNIYDATAGQFRLWINTGGDVVIGRGLATGGGITSGDDILLARGAVDSYIVRPNVAGQKTLRVAVAGGGPLDLFDVVAGRLSIPANTGWMIDNGGGHFLSSDVSNNVYVGYQRNSVIFTANINHGGSFYKPGASDPLNVYCDHGYYARARFTVGGTRTWSAGCDYEGKFAIADETAGAFRLWIDTAAWTHVLGLDAGGGEVKGSSIAAYGSNCAFRFDDRSASVGAWLWYSTGGVARLWNGVDKFWVDTGGNCTMPGYVTAGDFRSNGNLYCPNGYCYAPVGTSTFSTVTTSTGAYINGYYPGQGFGLIAQYPVELRSDLYVRNSVSVTSSLGASTITCTQINANVARFSVSGGQYPLGLTTDQGYASTCYFTQTNIRTWEVGCMTGAYNGFLVFEDSSLAQPRGWFQTDGNFVVQAHGFQPGGGTWGDYSDIRLKRDVAPYAAGLAEISQLRPVRYRFNGLARTQDDGRVFTGLVADEVREIMPEMVGTMQVKLDPNDAEDSELLTLDATPLIYALVNSCKELAARVEELERRGS
jgi:hypothetical protein